MNMSLAINLKWKSSPKYNVLKLKEKKIEYLHIPCLLRQLNALLKMYP